jgi:hypothetical protein
MARLRKSFIAVERGSEDIHGPFTHCSEASEKVRYGAVAASTAMLKRKEKKNEGVADCLVRSAEHRVFNT